MITAVTRMSRFGSTYRAGTLAVAVALAILGALLATASAPAATGEVAIDRLELKSRNLSVGATCHQDAVARLRLDGRSAGRTTLRCRGGNGSATFRLSAAAARRARSTQGISAGVTVTANANADRFTARLRRPDLGRRSRNERIARAAAVAPHWSRARAQCVSSPEYGYKSVDLVAYSETYGVQAGQQYAYRMWVLTADRSGGNQRWLTYGWRSGFAALYPTQGFPLSGSSFWASVGVENAFGQFRWVTIFNTVGPVDRGYTDHDWCFFR